MADLEKSVAIIFEGVDQMGSGIDSATRRIDGFADKMENVAAPVAGATKSILAAETAAGAMAFVFGSRAYDAAVKFEGAQADLAKTLGEGDGSVDQYTRKITDLSNTYGESSAALLQSMANYKQAGFTAKESLGLVKSGLDLVISGDVEAGEASEILVSSLKGFKAPASDANELLEVLNASSNTYATNVSELAKGMSQLSPIASTLGLDFNETAELLIPVIEVFRSGPEAANALRTGLLRLGDDSKPVTETLEKIGVAQRDANGVLRSSQSILQDVASATGEMTNSEKLFVTQQLFGIEQSAKMVEVLDSLEGSSVDVSKALKESSTVAEEVAIKLDTAEKAGDRTRESFENLARTLGMQFKDELAGIVDGVGDIYRAFEESTAEGALDGFFDELNPILGEVERLAEEIAAALPAALEDADYSGFSNGLNALFGDLENVEVTAEDLQAVIEGLGDGFQALSKFTAGTFDVFKGFAEVLGPVIEGFTSLDSETQQWIGVIGGVSMAVSPVVGVLGTLTTAAAALGGKKGIVPIAIKSVGGLSRALKVLGGPAGAALIAVGALGELKETLDEFNEFRFNFSDELEEELDKTTGAQRKSTEASLFLLDKIAEGYNNLSDKFGWGDEAAGDFETLSAAAIDAANQVAASTGALGDEGAQEVKKLSQTAIDMAKKIDQARNSVSDGLSRVDAPLIDQIIEMPGTFWDAADGIHDGSRKIAATSEEIADALGKVGVAFQKGKINEEQYIAASQALADLQKQVDKNAKSQKVLADKTLKGEEAIVKARKAVLDQELALEELASNERIKGMEFAVDVKVAQLEADTKRVEAILSATSDTISSTAEAATSLFDTIAGGDLSGFQEFKAQKAIEQQLEIQQQAADQQERLIDAQVRSLNEKTRALQRGDGLIKIESDGLEPALEMIMWEVLEKIQMRANAEGAEFLLGL